MVAALRVLINVTLDELLAPDVLHLGFGKAMVVHERTPALSLAVGAMA